MNRRQLLSAAAAPLLAQSPSRKPNIVLIVTDDHHWQCLGAAGNPHIATPHLDRLARRGVNFSNGIISTSQCAPSRGILLSGQEIYQTGLESNGRTGFQSFKGPTIVEQLRSSGYDTNLIGKWHIKPLPAECGFTKAPVWLRGGGSPYRNPNLRHGLTANRDQETPGHITSIFTEASVDIIKRAKPEHPYLLWLTYNAPHTPWSASAKFQAMYAGRNAGIAPPRHPRPGPGRPFDWETYYAVISELDEGIGRVVSAIEQSGQWDNTLILAIGDNGYLCGSKGFEGKVRPWEESIRVPYIAGGGLVKRSSTSAAAVASVDIPATMLDYAGVRPAHTLAGVTLRPVLEGRKFAREAAFSSWTDGRPEALAVKQAVEPYRLVRTPKHKYILWESKNEALFDLTADPFEEMDLAGKAGPLAKRMRDLLRMRMSETSDPALAWLS